MPDRDLQCIAICNFQMIFRTSQHNLQQCVLCALQEAVIAYNEYLLQVLFQDGKFQWKRLQNLIGLAREGTGGLDLSDTVRDGARVLLLDEKLRRQLLLALTEDNRLHIEVRAFTLLYCQPISTANCKLEENT